MDTARQLAIFAVLASFVVALVLSITLNYHYYSSASDINQKLEAQLGQVQANTGYFNVSMTRASDINQKLEAQVGLKGVETCKSCPFPDFDCCTEFLHALPDTT